LSTTTIITADTTATAWFIARPVPTAVSAQLKDTVNRLDKHLVYLALARSSLVHFDLRSLNDFLDDLTSDANMLSPENARTGTCSTNARVVGSLDRFSPEQRKDLGENAL
jgi:hypothetical protein